MKEFETYEEIIIADTDKGVVELALEASSDYYRKPLFKVEESDDPAFDYSLTSYIKKIDMYQYCWGLGEAGEGMTLKEALENFDYLEEQYIKKILDQLNIDYNIKKLNN